ncbi:sensor histidine kinase [Pseudodesulfovibrio sediminis]|uniref:histidine kinase n=1 Tax=Pseudodesulfovibrio sediminis TaxID=2810563 RepID=A0ABN6ESU9_9BACT|nr:PAS domain-containing sensor histidine kinase [Pseudodesulfovibrio sediminis]BCS89431.1 hypothetical protein PSDVSF_26730 [Pseudodesulfovibrio sediminis]
MVDVALETLRAFLLAGILSLFIYADRGVVHERRAYLYIKIGLLLLLFGAIVDITDNFESLNWTVVAGKTPIGFFLKAVVGYVAGLTLLLIGLWRWLPSINIMEQTQEDLECSQKELDCLVQARTRSLEKEIDKRRIVEANLLIAEEQRTALYENAPVAIVHGIIGGNLMQRNQAYARMLGYDSPEEIEQRIRELRDPFFIWPYRKDVERMISLLKSRTHIKDFEGRLRRKDGRIIQAAFSFRTLEDRDGENYYFYGFAEDVTERNKSEKHLAYSEARLQTIMDFMPAGLFLVDAMTRNIIDVNQALLDMTGYTREELVGFHCCDKVCPQHDRLCPIVDKGQEINLCERLVMTKDGTEIPVIKTVAGVTLDGADCLLETLVDISEQKRLEQLKEDVDRIVAHDLKSPVASVISACKMLLMDYGLDKDTREMLEIIQRQSSRTLRMLNMSLTIYKIEAGTFVHEVEAVDLLGILDTVLDEVAELIRSNSLTVRLTLDGEPLSPGGVFPLEGNQTLFESMFANLLTNAIEESSFGEQVTIALTSGTPVTIAITNTGVVPEAIRDSFFEKYVTSGKMGGTGLGTYSASLVVRAVGGEISMQTSDETHTTTVTVSLPGSEGSTLFLDFPPR